MATMVLTGPGGVIAAGSGWGGTRAWAVAAVMVVVGLAVLARGLRGRSVRRRTGGTQAVTLDQGHHDVRGGGEP